DKLLSAYALADWSEEYFNNRALFSDYYLKARLQDFPEWREDPKPVYLRLRELYQGAPSRFSGKDKGKAILCKELLEPALAALGFQFKWARRAAGTAEPDYRLYAAGDGKSPLALCLAYAWDRYLDGKDDQRDKETPEENPGAAVVTLLEKGEAPWVVVTNGRIWRLYAQRTHARATNYYEIDLEEVLAQAGPHVPDPAEAFRYFWLVFRSEAFVPAETEREGKKTLLSLLDRLLLESEDYAKELGERLKERVFVQVFPYLAEGFIRYIREGEALEAALSQHRLDKIFQGTLTLLYRILFLLYAEARDLLPVKEVRGYFEASLTKLKREVAEAAGTIDDQVEDKLKKRYREESYELYDRLGWLFRTVDKGDPALNVPIYNGGLFLSDPDDKEDTAEAEAARFLNAMKVGDRYLARAIDLLARVEDPKRHDLVSIDFKSLGVRHLGSIYEGLLEFKLRIAERKLAVVKEKGREVYTDFSELDERARERAERQGRVVRKGQVYLENDKRERKATGSYYTPDHIVMYIVEHAVGPVLQEKFEAMRPKLREAQQKRRAFFEKQEALCKQGLRPEPESKAEFIGQEVVDELFDIKILDPAMGSGHFLVDAVDFITDKALDFLNAFPWNPVFARLNRMREAILQEMEDQGITIDARRLTDVNLLKRHVLKRCIYGVDINPMAVELAKVSLWLDCFTLGAPLSFLDHHLRCGNSLIGVTVEEIDTIRAAKGQLLLSASSDWQGLLQAIQGMMEVGGLPDVTSAQVARSRSVYKSALSNLENFKKILDVHTARWFVDPPNGKAKSKKTKPKEDPFDYILKSGDLFQWSHGKKAPLLDIEPYRSLLSACASAAREKRFFHWELEFPEVFYGPRPGTRQAIDRLDHGGFDAVIGNPPYINVVELPEHIRDWLLDYYKFARGRVDIYLPFFERALSTLAPRGRTSFITPNKWFVYSYGQPTRDALLTGPFHWLSAVDLALAPSIFKEGDTYSQISVFRKPTIGDQRPPIRIYRFLRDESEYILDLSRACEAGVAESFIAEADLFAQMPQAIFSPRLNVAAQGILRKIVSISDQIGDLFDVEQLIRIGSAEKRNQLIVSRSIARQEPTARKVIDADELESWAIAWEGRYLLYKPNKLYNPKSPRIFEQPKIFIKDTSTRLRAVPDFGDESAERRFRWFYALNTVYGLIPRENKGREFVGFVSCCLNSPLSDYLYKTLFGALTIGGGFIRFREFIQYSPVRRIEFRTPIEERSRNVKGLVDHYTRLLELVVGTEGRGVVTETFGKLLLNVGGLGESLGIPEDTLHDFLAHLAQQMVELNKLKQTEISRFLGWLEKEAEIGPDEAGNTGIEALSGRSIIKDFLGDYDIDEGPASFEDLWEILLRNRSRIGRSLERALADNLKREYEKTLGILLPIKQRLTATDWLIDQLVYRLYGLTEEEIAVLEGKQ
ncbi:MAG: Eco57I restriction-modification methylase domain-containing protein, partial [Candidatus Binatia bacterium]